MRNPRRAGNAPTFFVNIYVHKTIGRTQFAPTKTRFNFRKKFRIPHSEFRIIKRPLSLAGPARRA